MAERTAILPGGCHEWVGPITPTGYGRVNALGFEGFAYAHRLRWRLAHGPIPDGMQVLHACDNPCCVNIDHLRIGTVADNMREKAERGRAARNKGMAKLSPRQVRAIRKKAAAGMSQRELGRLYGISSVAVCHLVNRKTWKDVE